MQHWVRFCAVSIAVLLLTLSVRAADGYALLVGVSKYEHFDKAQHLDGPVNDVLLMRDLLVKRFGFPADNIVMLSEAQGEGHAELLPTKENIKREMLKLAERAKEGRQLVVYLTGHGHRQPERPDDPQPDGMEKLFLPRDVSGWDTVKDEVPNAITGRELKVWLQPVVQAKAQLWFIVDSCHSGTIVRGPDGVEHERSLPDKALSIPAAKMDKARGDAAERNKKSPPDRFSTDDKAPLRLAANAGVIALYACQSSETTPEREFTGADGHEQWYGLLTYTMAQILEQADSPLTYRELVVQLHRRYAAMGRMGPTPLAEGQAIDQKVLGTEKLGRSSTYLQKYKEKYRLNKGKLHGLTVDSVFAVYPPPGEKDADKVVGHVRIERLNMTTAEVVPCEFEGKAESRDLPDGGRCELVRVDFGDMQLRVAVDRDDPKSSVEKELQKIQETLQKLDGAAGPLVKIVDLKENPQWVLRAQPNKVAFVSASEFTQPSPSVPTLAIDDKLPKTLSERLARIARAENLKSLAGSPDLQGGGDFRPQVEVEIWLKPKKGEKRRLDKNNLLLKDGDEIEYRLKNIGRVKVDVTVLYIDSSCGITPLFPLKGEDNRLSAGKGIPLPIVDVSADTVGLEHLIVLAVPGDGNPPADFTEFAQAGIGNPKGLNTPMGKLLQRCMQAKGNKGQGRKEVESLYMDLIPMRTVR